MKATSRTAGGHRTAARLVAALVGVLVAFSAATGFAAKGDETKEEKKVEVFEAENQKERPTLKDEEQGPKFKAEEFISEKNFQSVKKQDEAIVRLRDLLESMPPDDPQRAEILFNLSEMYWNKSKYYEMSYFRKQDECARLKEAGETGRHQSCTRQMKMMDEESKRLREKAVGLYKKIIRNYPNFEQLDKILFYLGNNLQEAGRKEEAVKVYRKLLSNFPNTKYIPNVLLALGEYFFDEKGNADRALDFYQKVSEFKKSSVYSYARYKAAWCHYNLDRKDKALDIFIDVVEYAKAHPNQPNARALVTQVRKDIVLTYAEVGAPSNAIDFFRDITGGDEQEVLKMGERLAIHYADKGRFNYSTKMYRKLIRLNRNSVKTIDYQYEIVRNHTSQNPYAKDTIEELVKVMKLVEFAEKGKFEDYGKKKFGKTKDRIEQLVRQWATRYHREAQVTKNPSLYKMAFFLYNGYLNTFPDTKHTYLMTFFNGEILYHLEKWQKAAQMYERVLEMNDQGKWTQEAAHAQVLAYFNLVNTSEEKADLENPLKFEKKDQAKEVEDSDGGEEDKVPAKKKISEVKQKLIAACKDYSKYVPDGERIVDVKYTMARVFYEHNHLQKAVDLFRDIAFNHSDHRLAVVAANLHLDSLNLLNDFKALNDAVAAYIDKKPIREEEFMGSVRTLNEAIRFKLCRQKEDAEQWRAAATCYVQFYRDFKGSQYVAKALYNAALAFERIKELGKAIQVRVFLLKARPNSELAPKTLYNIGGNYHALAVYSRAASFYEKFVEEYPDHENARVALANAATFRRGLGDYEQAIADFEKFLELFSDEKEYAEKSADVAYQIAKIYEGQGEGWKALEQYREYLDNFKEKGTLDRLLQVHASIGMFFWSQDDQGQALKEFERTLEVYSSLSKKEREGLTDGRDAAARAKFMIGESVYQEMAEITVKSANEEELQKRFKKKMKVAEKAQKLYEEVITFRRPHWAIAALYKIGAQYQNFADTMRNSPVPDRLSYNQAEMYRGMLEDRAGMVEKKAVDAYKRALQVAKDQSWFNEYSRKAEIRLADLRPAQFRKPSEMRAEPDHFNDGYSRSTFIDELEEDEERLDKLGDRSPAPNGGNGGDETAEEGDPTGDASAESTSGKPAAEPAS